MSGYECEFKAHELAEHTEQLDRERARTLEAYRAADAVAEERRVA
jgi:hypothetical protein